MSIVPLERVTFVGLSPEKDRLLDDLHARGCLELIPLATDERVPASGGPSSEAREALKFLLSCPQRRRQVSDDARFDAESVERRALDLQKNLQSLESERDMLLERVANAKPWGDFHFSSLQEMGEMRLWFYVVPHKDMPKVEATELAWQVVRRDPRFCYVVVVQKTEPESMPVPRVHLGARSPEELQRRLEEVELAIEDVQAERAHLTRWCLLFARDLARLEDAAARATQRGRPATAIRLFALQAWAPKQRVPRVGGICGSKWARFRKQAAGSR